MGQSENLGTQLHSLKGSTNVVVRDAMAEIDCVSLAEAKEHKAEATAVGIDSARIVLRHNGDLAGVFDTNGTDEEGLGCVR